MNEAWHELMNKIKSYRFDNAYLQGLRDTFIWCKENINNPNLITQQFLAKVQDNIFNYKEKEFSSGLSIITQTQNCLYEIEDNFPKIQDLYSFISTNHISIDFTLTVLESLINY